MGLLEERSTVESKSISFISFPIPDRGIPESLPAALSLVADIARLLDAGKNGALHCRQSVGQAGLIAAAGVLMVEGVGPDQAIEVVSLARGLAIPETSAQ